MMASLGYVETVGEVRISTCLVILYLDTVVSLVSEALLYGSYIMLQVEDSVCLVKQRLFDPFFTTKLLGQW